jgi:hypothetical protein
MVEYLIEKLTTWPNKGKLLTNFVSSRSLAHEGDSSAPFCGELGWDILSHFL